VEINEDLRFSSQAFYQLLELAEVTIRTVAVHEMCGSYSSMY
jgi:hypothetical protein